MQEAPALEKGIQMEREKEKARIFSGGLPGPVCAATLLAVSLQKPLSNRNEILKMAAHSSTHAENQGGLK